MSKVNWSNIVAPLVVFMLFLVAWDRAVVFWNIKPFVLPSPLGIVQVLPTKQKDILIALRTTSIAASAGLGLAVLVGVVVSIFLAQSRLLYRSFGPYMVLLPAIPVVAVAPLIIIWCGQGMHSVILVAFWISVFPIVVNTTQGLMSVDKNLTNLFLVNDASTWQILWKLKLPNAMPYLLTGLKVSSSLAVIGALVGEIYAGRVSAGSFGLGYAITFASNQLETDYLFALVLACAVLGLAFFALSSFVGWWFLHHWHESALTPENE